MPKKIADKVLSWATDLEDNTINQAATSARLPFVQPHLALMPDAHLGFGATVGSVIPTRGAIIPSAVGVDIGCGMVAVETTLTASDLPDDLTGLLSLIEQRVPAGVGQGHEHDAIGASWMLDESERSGHTPELDGKLTDRACKQFGTLGSGNHFIEVCLDERETVWVVLHSGSRGVGNQLAQRHIESAKGLMSRYFITLDDPDLAYLVEGTSEFDAYIRDLQWAQSYALGNRERMMDEVLDCVTHELGLDEDIEHNRINCHHNYTKRENHMGKNLWVTRKGAISAREGQRGVIPGSMGASSFIVTGLGNSGSFHSASHGAGRRMSRGQARRSIVEETLRDQMKGKAWLESSAKSLLDEAPDAYKDIDEVMEAQKDLVKVDHRLTQILNYKGL